MCYMCWGVSYWNEERAAPFIDSYTQNSRNQGVRRGDLEEENGEAINEPQQTPLSKWNETETCDDCGKELSEGELTECANCEQKSSERAMYPN